MPCPFFLPSIPAREFDAGICLSGDSLRDCCATGYGRGQCHHAAQSDADAVRFLVKREHNGAVEVAWSMERDHHPVAVGIKTIKPGAAQDEDTLTRQARACAEDYWHWRRD